MRIIVQAALAALLVLPLAVTAHKDGPPANRTGGFGEPSCHACHLDNPVNTAGGTLRLAGVPTSYIPSRHYRIIIELVREGIERAGFQMSARLLSGKQAGAWSLSGAGIQFKESETDPALQFVEQTAAGSLCSPAGSARWAVDWTAPSAGAGPVEFHAAANASNDDASALGDFIYLAAARSSPAK